MQVKQVECNYKDRLDSLMVENTQLRRRLFSTTDQYSAYRSNVERLQAETIYSAKEKVRVCLYS